MATDQQEILKALNDLIATCHDAEEGYAKAAKGVHDHALSDRLTAISGERGAFAAELKEIVSGLGAEASTDAHYGGILHRGWVDLETRIRPKSVADILDNCRAGDEATLNHYNHALGLELAGDLRSAIERQRNAVQAEMDSLQEYRTKHGHA